MGKWPATRWLERKSCGCICKQSYFGAGHCFCSQHMTSESCFANNANTKAKLQLLFWPRPSGSAATFKGLVKRMRKLLWCLLVISSGHASETLFSVQDDVLAYPQVNMRLRRSSSMAYLLCTVRDSLLRYIHIRRRGGEEARQDR